MNLKEINRLIATKVMEWSVYKEKSGFEWYAVVEDGKFKFIRSVVTFEPTTDIRDAWKVVDKFVNDDIYFEMVKPDKDGSFICLIGMLNEPTKADTAPLAICLAALKAVGVNIE